MSLISRVASVWRTLFRKSRLERELDDELRGAAGALEDRYLAGGMSPEEARRAARLALGGVEPVKDAVRDVRVGVQIETIALDVRYVLRTLRKSPAFTAAAVLSLADLIKNRPPIARKGTSHGLRGLHGSEKRSRTSCCPCLRWLT